MTGEDGDGQEPDPSVSDSAPILISLAIAVTASPIASFMFHRPTPPPGAFGGCYGAADAPWLRLSGNDLTVGQPNIGSRTVRVDFEKWGPLVITPTPPLHFEHTETGAFLFDRGGGGLLWFMRPGHLVDGKRYGVLAAEDTEFIEVTATDGSVVAFKPIRSSQRHATPKPILTS